MKVLDLFAGCGGLSLGMIQAGHEIVAALDNWEPALLVYRENFKHHPVIKQDLADIESSISIVESFNPQMICGGPPCQDFSSAGLRDSSGAHADLTYSFADIVCATKPEFFVMENVERIRKSQILEDVMTTFSKCGYGLTPVILDASYCGAPQARLRFFLIGHLNANNNFLLGHLLQGLSDEPMTMRDYFGEELGTEFYYRHPRNYNRRAIYGLDEPSATIRGVNRPIPPGYVLNKNDPAGIKLKQVRPLTTAERAQVQTFPKDFKFLGPKTSQEQMIGNAVPVALGKFIGEALCSYLLTGSVVGREQEELFTPDILAIPDRPLRPIPQSVK